MDVKGVGKPSVFQNDESKFYEWAKKIEDCLIGIEPHPETILTWLVRTRPTSDRACLLTRLETRVNESTGVLAHLTEGVSWSMVQHCGRNGLEAWRGPHTGVLTH